MDEALRNLDINRVECDEISALLGQGPQRP